MKILKSTNLDFPKSIQVSKRYCSIFILSISLLLLLNNVSKAQIVDLGKGIVKIGMYGFEEDKITVFDEANLVQYFTYFIDKDKILRKEDLSINSSRGLEKRVENVTSVSMSKIIMPTYLLNFADNQSYLIYIDSSDTYYVNQSPLANFTIDPFYLQNGELKTNFYNDKKDDSAFSIEDPKISKSYTVTVLPPNSLDSVHLEYVNLHWPICSPLNTYLPEGYNNSNVIKMTTKTTGIDSGGKQTKYTVVFKVEKIDNMKELGDILQIPDNAIYLDSKYEVINKYKSNN